MLRAENFLPSKGILCRSPLPVQTLEHTRLFLKNITNVQINSWFAK